MPTWSLVIMVEEIPLALGFDRLAIYEELTRGLMELVLVGLKMVIWFTTIISV